MGCGDGEEQELLIESINASSAIANRLALMESDSHVQFAQGTCFTKALQAAFDKEAKDYSNKTKEAPSTRSTAKLPPELQLSL